MRANRVASAIAAVALSSAALSQTILHPVQGLLVGRPDASNALYTPDLSGGYRLSLNALNSFFVVHLPAGTSFAGRTHVDLEFKNNVNRPALLEVDISSNNGAGWLSGNVVLGALESAQVTVPLFSGEQYGLRVLPSPTDTTAAQLRSAGNIFLNDVRGIYLFNKDKVPADVSVRLIGASNHIVPLNGFVDTFGQQRNIAWAEKITNVTQMRDMVSQEPNGVYPYAADAFGGIAGSKNYGAATRFRTHKDGNQWFLVDPLGNRFFSMGINEVGAQAHTPVTGREAMFTDLPNLRSQFPSHFRSWDGVEYMTPYSINLERKFGPTWKTDIVPLFMKRMRSWGFNTAGVSSWDDFMMQKQMPSTFGLNVISPHARFHAYDGRTMPDIFDPSWEQALNADIETRLREAKANHQWNIGMFLDNELPWGRGKSDDINGRNALAVAALNSPQSASHAKFMKQLQNKYVTIAKLNAAWGTQFANWTALQSGNIKFSNSAPAAVDADLRKFIRTYADVYFAKVDRAIANSGYQGLYLGCRFTKDDYTKEILNIAMRYVDVLSFNIYEAFPTRTNPDVKSLDFPVMISEVSFGANDQGRAGMPLFPTLTEKSRIDTFRRYFNGLKSWKNLVGVHWYRWEDFPSTAKADHDNMQEGLITITDRFYTGMVNQTASSSKDYMSHLLGLP